MNHSSVGKTSCVPTSIFFAVKLKNLERVLIFIISSTLCTVPVPLPLSVPEHDATHIYLSVNDDVKCTSLWTVVFQQSPVHSRLGGSWVVLSTLTNFFSFEGNSLGLLPDQWSHN